MEDVKYKNILLTEKEQIATITINRPNLMNPLDRPTIDEVTDALRVCDRTKEVRVVVVTGAGRAFSAGGDIRSFKELLSAEDGFDIKGFEKDIYDSGEMSIAARSCRKPTIAMVNGSCIGAGMSLALSCDFRIISPDTVMSAAFINLGFTGDTGIVYMLKEHLGYAKMLELMTLGTMLNAEKIMELGLATKVATEGELEAETMKLAKKLAAGPACAYAKQKELFNRTFFRDYDIYAEYEAKYMAECGGTEDFKEAVSAFLEKRRPHFQGK